jgi:hypothetical protein
MKGEAKTVFEGLCQDLIRLNANWRMFRQLFTVSDDRFEVFNQTAPGFFKLLQDLLVDDAVNSLSRLTDQADCQSLPRLVKLLKNQVTPAFHKELADDLNALRAACDDIRKHRDKRVAHRARSTREPQLSPVPTKLPPLTRKKIELAMALSAALLNKVLGNFESTEQLFVPCIRGDAESLFHFVERGRNAAEAEKATMLSRFAQSKSA